MNRRTQVHVTLAIFHFPSRRTVNRISFDPMIKINNPGLSDPCGQTLGTVRSVKTMMMYPTTTCS